MNIAREDQRPLRNALPAMTDKMQCGISTSGSDSALKPSAESSPKDNYGAAVMGLATNFSQMNQCKPIKSADLEPLEDYNNNPMVDRSCSLFASPHCGKPLEHQTCEPIHYDNFVTTEALATENGKWNNLRLRCESPYLNNIFSSPPLNKSLSSAGLPAISSSAGGSMQHPPNILGGNVTRNATANGSLPSKSCNGNIGSFQSSVKKGENCMTHAMPNTLWCLKCHTLICRACAGSDEHRNHSVKTQAKEALRAEIAAELVTMQKTLIEAQHLVLKQRDFLFKVLESCSNLKSQIESELVNHTPTAAVTELREHFYRAKLCLNVLDQTAIGPSVSPAATLSSTPTPMELYKLYTTLIGEKQRLHEKHQELYLQSKFEEILRSASTVLDFESMSKPLQATQIYGDTNGAENSVNLLLMTNYCLTKIYGRPANKSDHGPLQRPLSSAQSIFGSDAFPYVNGGSTVNASITAGSVSSTHSTKSPFLDLTIGNSAAKSGHVQLPHSLHFSGPGSQLSSQSTFGHFGDAGSNSFSSIIGTSSNHGISSPLTTLRQGSAGSGGGSVSFEMNGISVPLSVLSSQKFTANTVMGQQQPSLGHHHPLTSHLHHHLLHSTNISSSSSNSSASNSIICNPTAHIYPVFFFNIEVNGQPFGRILIEVRNDVAPRMAKNFGALASGELGFGYNGCQIFQCWENESIITGDFELNNGRGGRSVFEEGFFMPDDTKILAIRGSVGMRRSQKRHDNMGLVGSQFRIILREMRGFTGIFAFVIEGLDLVEKISQTGDSAGKPQSNVLIASCGKLN